VLPKGYYSYKSQFMLYTLISCVIFNHKGYHTVTTIRVNHNVNYGNIMRLFSGVNSSLSDYKGH